MPRLQLRKTKVVFLIASTPHHPRLKREERCLSEFRSQRLLLLPALLQDKASSTFLDYSEASDSIVLGVGQQKETQGPFSESVECQLFRYMTIQSFVLVSIVFPNFPGHYRIVVHRI